MLVRLTKKLADVVNGIDLRHCNEGDVIELPARHAALLTVEGWAEPIGHSGTAGCRVWQPAADDNRPQRGDSLTGTLRRYMNIPNPKSARSSHRRRD